MSRLVKTIAVVTLTCGTPLASMAQKSFAGSTMYQPSPQYLQQQEEARKRAQTYYYRPAPPAYVAPQVNPTETWMYKHVAPYERYFQAGERIGNGAMRCGIGGAALATAGPAGAIVGCIGGVKGFN